MKKFFREHGIWVLFATAVIAVSLSLMSFFSNTSSPLSNLAGIIASPFRSAYTAVTGWITDKQNYYQDVTALEEENAALRRENAILKAQNRLAQTNNEENARLRDLLNLRPQNYDLELETASVTERTVTNWTSSLTLNIGTDHGVEVNDCVIDETYALVGVVSEVGLNWCTVLTIVDTDTSLGAQVFRTKDLGLAVGDFSLMRENRLRLDYLPADCQLLGGDMVDGTDVPTCSERRLRHCWRGMRPFSNGPCMPGPRQCSSCSRGRCSSGSPSGASFPLCSPSWWRSWVCMRVPSPPPSTP